MTTTPTPQTYIVQLTRTVRQIRNVTIEAISQEKAEEMAMANHPDPTADSGWEEETDWVIDWLTPPKDTAVNDSWAV